MAACTAAPLSPDVVAAWRAGEGGGGAAADVGDHRFSMAWGRQPHQPFPSYADCWPSFAEKLHGLLRAHVAAGEDEPTCSDCELHYVNPVTLEEQSSRHVRLERLILRWLMPGAGEGWLPAPEGVVTDATFPMTRAADGAPGRLCVRMHAVPTEASEPLQGMTLSAHCTVEAAGLDALETAFHTAFDWIVRGYATLAEPVGERP